MEGRLVDKVRYLSAVMPDLLGVSDGNYVGEYSVLPVCMKVEVSVNHHQISQITILQHDNGLGRAAENIVDDVIENQSLDIDTVSGATLSSKCILKAIENAMEGKDSMVREADLSRTEE